MIDPKEHRARAAYHAYGAVTSWRNFRGEPMPPWQALPDSIKGAWEAATEATRQRSFLERDRASRIELHGVQAFELLCTRCHLGFHDDEAAQYDDGMRCPFCGGAAELPGRA